MDSVVLHSATEAHGAVVVAEAGPWGSEVAGDDVAFDGDPMMALADKYRRDSIGQRTPVTAFRNSLLRMLDGVDAVVVVLPPEDTVFGWDYPAFRDLLSARGIPHACLRCDPYRPLSANNHDRLHALLSMAEPTGQVRHV
jgi:hypothetical protein